MKRYLAALALASSAAIANPFVQSGVSDKTFLAPGVIQCGVFLDAAPKVVIPVTAVTGGNVCQVDVGSVTVGAHTISFTAITVNDPVWGSLESARSVPLAFSRPGVPPAPTGLLLTP